MFYFCGSIEHVMHTCLELAQEMAKCAHEHHMQVDMDKFVSHFNLT